MSWPPETDEDGFGPDEVIRATGVSHETLGKIRAYLLVLDRWRERINLIGPGEGKHLWRRHVLDSVQLLPRIGTETKEIADLGSGAGFPGLIIACEMAVRCGTTVTLVEKSPRKSEFLEAAIAELGLPGRVLTQRLEDKPPYRYDLVTARALAPLPKLLGYGYQWLKPSGKALLMKGRDMAAELALARESWTFDLSVLPSASSPEGHILEVSGLKVSGPSPRRG